MKILQKTIEKIKPLDGASMEKARKNWDGKVKPLGSLGKMEEMTIQLAGIQGREKPAILKKAIVVFCGDNGVFEADVSASLQSFTRLLALATAKGQTGVSTLGKMTETDIFVVDVGMNGDITHPNIIDRKVANGSKNFVKERAMSPFELEKALLVGIEMAEKLALEAYDICGVGELGIGNTTTSAAILSVLTGKNPGEVAGKGAGITNKQLEKKIAAIEQGIQKHQPQPDNPLELLEIFGGFDIASMVGFYLGAASLGKPVVIDGFISSVAALIAYRLAPKAKDYFFPSHISKEAGAKTALDALKLEAILHMDMRLGEGSACPLLFMLMGASLYTYENMGTFRDATIDQDILIDLRVDE